MIRLVIFGRQGAGKGTQAQLLAENFGAPHISTGDMLREAVADGSPVGQKVQPVLEAGELVSDSLMLEVIHDRFSHDDVIQNGFILDGFPRTKAQAEALLSAEAIDLAVNIDVPEDIVLSRLSSRRVCENGHIYSSDDPAIASGFCTEDGTPIHQRRDDTPTAITARLDAYATKTMLAVAYFDSKGLLLSVNGVGTPDEVSKRMFRAIDERLKLRA